MPAASMPRALTWRRRPTSSGMMATEDPGRIGGVGLIVSADWRAKNGQKKATRPTTEVTAMARAPRLPTWVAPGPPGGRAHGPRAASTSATVSHGAGARMRATWERDPVSGRRPHGWGRR